MGGKCWHAWFAFSKQQMSRGCHEDNNTISIGLPIMKKELVFNQHDVGDVQVSLIDENGDPRLEEIVCLLRVAKVVKL